MKVHLLPQVFNSPVKKTDDSATSRSQPFLPVLESFSYLYLGLSLSCTNSVVVLTSLRYTFVNPLKNRHRSLVPHVIYSKHFNWNKKWNSATRSKIMYKTIHSIYSLWETSLFDKSWILLNNKRGSQVYMIGQDHFILTKGQ